MDRRSSTEEVADMQEARGMVGKRRDGVEA